MDTELVTVPSFATLTTRCLASSYFENFGLKGQWRLRIGVQYILEDGLAPLR